VERLLLDVVVHGDLAIGEIGESIGTGRGIAGAITDAGGGRRVRDGGRIDVVRKGAVRVAGGRPGVTEIEARPASDPAGDGASGGAGSGGRGPRTERAN